MQKIVEIYMRSTAIQSVLSDVFWSHPDKLYIDHIRRMLDVSDSEFVKKVKIFHDIAKLKIAFQKYIRNTNASIADKNHSLLSAYIFLENYIGDDLDIVFGFLAIVSHHGEVHNLYDAIRDNFCLNVKELDFANKVIQNAKMIDIYENIAFSKNELEDKTKKIELFLMHRKFRQKFDYQDFINFKSLYSNLIYSDKYEAIFSDSKITPRNIDLSLLESHIKNLKPHQKRDKFRKFVLNNFDKDHKLFTLTAPTGYGKTLTALNFALKFKKDRVIFTLPFTTIIDQAYDIINEIYGSTNTIFKIHHKTTINEDIDSDRYSKIKFIMDSFSGDINVTTLYQLIFTIFGNSNKDNVKFNQLKNSVIIIDEAQAIPYQIRMDFLRLCEIISEQLNTVFIFMSATMPIINSNKFREISNLDYFSNQKRYDICWLQIDKNQEILEQKISEAAKENHTLVVVNTVEKAQELYYKFKDDFECYSLTSYMVDEHKQMVISKIQNKLSKNDTKILLISTQSIEAGVDVSFEIGFREIAPISSIIQTAGRINRHFGGKKGKLYVFDDICKYSDVIYGNLQKISNSIISDILKPNDLCESEILGFANLYFKKINTNLESYYVEDEIKNLEFASINSKISEILEVEKCKRMLVIEPTSDFIDRLEAEYRDLQNQNLDKFNKLNKIDKIIKKLMACSINISNNDFGKIQTGLKDIEFIKGVKALPCFASEYDKNVGFKKCNFIKNPFS